MAKDPWAVAEVGVQSAPQDPWGVSGEAPAQADPWGIADVAPGAPMRVKFDLLKRTLGATFGITPVKSLVEKTVTPTATFAAKEILSNTPMAAAWRTGKKIEGMSRSGLRQLTESIPETPNTRSATANYLMRAASPKLAAQFLTEFAPSFISPEAAVLQGAGGLVTNASALPAVRKAGGAIADAIPAPIKRAFTYRFGQPELYQDIAELVKTKSGLGRETAKDLGKALTDGLSKEERLRLGQLVRGGVSESQRELPLRLRANYARGVLDDLEAQAKELNLIPENVLSKYTKRQMADLRLKKAVVDARISNIKDFGSKAKRGLLGKADQLEIQGATGLVRKVEGVEKSADDLKTMMDEAKDVLTAEEFKGLEEIMSNETLRRSKAVTRMVSRFEKASIGRQERMFDQLTRAAERMGVKIDKVYESELSINNFRGLIKKIESLSGRFPGKARLLAELGQKSESLQNKIVNHYTQSGQKYMPRLYKGKEVPEDAAGMFGFSPIRMDRSRFMKRGDFSETSRMNMGEIREPAYPVAKGVAQVSSDIEKAKLFKQVSENPAWTTSDEALAAKQDFTKMPVSKRLGNLSGQHVHPEIARDINEINRVPGTAQKVYDNFISKWKYSKVVANPATHFRNIMSNSILLDMGGVSHIEQPRLLLSAATELWKKGKYFHEAKASGLLGHEFVGGEIKAFRDALISEPFSPNLMQRAAGLARKVAEKAGDLYQGEEQVFKLAKFIKNRRMGMDVKAATADAEKWLFNYDKVSPAVKAIRSGRVPALGILAQSPFITFTSKALPRVAETAIKNPLRLYKYKLMFDAMEQVGLDRGVFTEKDREIIKRNSRGQVVILPMKDQDGKPAVLDLSYILPWGDVGETGGMFGLPSALPPSGPAKSLLDIGYNKSTFNDQEIYNKETDTTSEKAAKISDFMLKTLLPSLTPGVDRIGSPFKGGYSYNRLAAAIKKEPYPRESRRGKVQSVPAAVASTIFGLKTTGADASQMLADEILKKKRAQEDLVTQTRRKLAGKGVSEAEKKRLIESMQKKVKNIWKTK